MGKRPAQSTSATAGQPQAKRFTADEVSRLLNNLSGYSTTTAATATEPQTHPAPELRPLMAVPVVNPLAHRNSRWPQPQTTIAVVPKPERQPSNFELRLRALESQVQLILSDQRHVATKRDQDLANLKESVDSILDTMADLQDRLDNVVVSAQPESPETTNKTDPGRPK
ncbi:hypothetical protein PRIPAC_91694 [Pristionchus pacificus]|uniref:Uncharacterized protein n=1 Tax=Pristionchus pacificus TaxID=54126 RepID=A0A454XUF8_PRIPA|nr:hypothetical protein PRIPAC_91694 [Pristionchus pacificus]|eukprot:PDM76264.1 hypothetical protein PRIPAC_39868 [Pristionchus pacificus]